MAPGVELSASSRMGGYQSIRSLVQRTPNLPSSRLQWVAR